MGNRQSSGVPAIAAIAAAGCGCLVVAAGVVFLVITLGFSGSGGSPAECATSESCASNGSCGVVEGECAPTLPAHCAQSQACRAPQDGPPGACRLDAADHRCAAAPTGQCAGTQSCTDEGLCSSEQVASGPISRTAPSTRLACAAHSDSDCWWSRACIQAGRCHASGGACVAGPVPGVHVWPIPSIPPTEQLHPVDRGARAFIAVQSARLEHVLAAGRVPAAWGWEAAPTEQMVDQWQRVVSAPIVLRSLTLILRKPPAPMLSFTFGISRFGQLRYEGGSVSQDADEAETPLAQSPPAAVRAVVERFRHSVVEQGCNGLPWVAEGDDRAGAARGAQRFRDQCDEIRRRLQEGYQLQQNGILTVRMEREPTHGGTRASAWFTVAVNLDDPDGPPHYWAAGNVGAF